MPKPSSRLVAGIAGVLLSTTLSAAPWSKPTCADCGVISEIRVVERQGQASGVGAVAGGVGGALIGNQMGKGKGNTAMTIVGAAGGAYAGHQVEKSMKKTRGWEVVVDMDDGRKQNFSYKSEPAYRKGDKVVVRDGKLLLVAQ